MLLSFRDIGESADGGVDLEFIAGIDAVDQALERFKRCHKAAVDGVAVEDPRVALGDDGRATGFLKRERSMLTRRAATEVAAADDDLELARVRVGLRKRDVAVRQSLSFHRYAAQRISAVQAFLIGLGEAHV